MMMMIIIAERQRAKRASEAPLISKIDNPSSQENLVMTSAYERATKRTPSAQTLREEGWGASRGKPHGGSKERHLFLAGFVRKKHSSVLVTSTNNRER